MSQKIDAGKAYYAKRGQRTWRPKSTPKPKSQERPKKCEEHRGDMAIDYLTLALRDLKKRGITTEFLSSPY